MQVELHHKLHHKLHHHLKTAVWLDWLVVRMMVHWW